MKKSAISNFLRKLGLIYYADWIMFFAQKRKNKIINKEFLLQNPGIQLPPDYLIYESFQINYAKYFTDSRETAVWLNDHFKKYIELKSKRILDWGCGPGRVIRHLHSVINNNCEFFGTDYNKSAIEWCIENLKGINFNNNSLTAKLDYDDGFMDVVYGISVFTHLSEQLHFDWYNELYRILKPGGIMLVTTQGDNFKVKLTISELSKYNNGQLIIRGNVKEGHRTYSAFHPKEFMRKLFGNVEILEHVITNPENGKSWLPQDVWIIRKNIIET
ncbi:MAG: class I SAM-dependent methyltransferase [Draconibacterium sp.]|nr:class I SAM-dependent methyltransferase [Draconibacterium sp.]